MHILVGFCGFPRFFQPEDTNPTCLKPFGDIPLPCNIVFSNVVLARGPIDSSLDLT